MMSTQSDRKAKPLSTGAKVGIALGTLAAAGLVSGIAVQYALDDGKQKRIDSDEIIALRHQLHTAERDRDDARAAHSATENAVRSLRQDLNRVVRELELALRSSGNGESQRLRHELARAVAERNAALARASARGAAGPSGRGDEVMLERIRAAMTCPISKDIVSDPIVLNGRVYEREQIVRWISQTGEDPQTRERCTLNDLQRNIALEDVVKALHGRSLFRAELFR